MQTTEEHMNEIATRACMVDNQLIEYVKCDNPMGKHWQRYSRLNIGVKDIRPRFGKFTTPWNTPNRNDLWAFPKLRYINDRLEDILNDRAIELFQKARDTDRDIYIMWSGGIDCFK